MTNDTENKIILLLGNIREDIGILKGDIRGVHKDVRRINGAINNLYKRTESLERSRSWQKGAVKVMSVVIGAIGTVLYLIFK